MHLCVGVVKCFISLQNIASKYKVTPHVLKFEHEFYLKCSRGYSVSAYKRILREPIRNQAKIMKLDNKEFKSCITEEVITLKNLFASKGYEIRIVGGAVRDLLMGIQPKDLDFATTATPVEMKELFCRNEIRMINDNGEKHGTITARINDQNFEVTALRIDVATNGRHAQVQFTKDWVLDANRRDLTVNAMYLGLDGTLYDYFNGYEDLKNRRLVFVGDAAARIEEDYLRILRYFRFYGRISERPDNHDEDVLTAIRENKEGLEKISGERIWDELNKILKGRFLAEIILKMISLGIGPLIGFPEDCDEVEFKTVCDRMKLKDFTAQPVTYLCALFRHADEITKFFQRIKPSCAERDLGLFILEHRKQTHSDSIKPYQILVFTMKNKNFVVELLKYQGKFDFVEELDKWEIPKFPVNGHMLKEIGVTGPAIGRVMNSLRTIWFEKDFNMPAEELLKLVSTISIKDSEQPMKKLKK